MLTLCVEGIQAEAVVAPERVDGPEVLVVDKIHGPADVMLTHDAPESSFGTRRVAEVMRTNPGGWPARALRYAAEGKHRLTTAFLAAQPRLLMHGHFHIRDETWIEEFGYPTNVVSLDCDGFLEGNLVVVTLPDRKSGEEPLIQGLALPSEARRAELPQDGLAPMAPASEWSLNDVVRVLDEGRGGLCIGRP